MSRVQVGIGLAGNERRDAGTMRRALDRAAQSGLDHVSFGDHVSFKGGAGNDGLIFAMAVAMLQPKLRVFPSVYLLPLRHPVPVARQIATLDALAPGRLIFGVGIGGEDPHEVQNCGVDPRTRGRRADEALEILRPLLRGETVTYRGQHFSVESVRIDPCPSSPIPVIVGGRSNAALHRTSRHGDGWLGIWNSARRFAEARAIIEREAERAGRENVDWWHGMQLVRGWRDSGARPRPTRTRHGGDLPAPVRAFRTVLSGWAAGGDRRRAGAVCRCRGRVFQRLANFQGCRRGRERGRGD